MGINVQIERADRTVVGLPLLDSKGDVARALARAWRDDKQDDFPISTSIDPYGDTLLNYLLTSLLLAELERLKAERPSDEVSLTAISGLGDYVVRNRAEHLFLAFIGD
jgi:hypothetical protein